MSPYANVPDELQDKMESCVQSVMDGGKEKEAAIAICYASVVEGKSLEFLLSDAVKVGARNNASDAGRLQTIHDLAVENGAMCAASAQRPRKNADEEMPKSPDGDGVVSFGGTVKALGGGKVGGYLIRFSGPDDPDLTGDFFTKDTDFDTDIPGSVRAYFNHGMTPGPLQKLSHRADLKMDEFGIWAETILDERNRYEAYLYGLSEKGKIGWSSGTAGHLMQREQVRNANFIKAWVIAESSLTHMPAEPRNSVIPVKSLTELLPPPDVDLMGVTPGSHKDAAEKSQNLETLEEAKMTDNAVDYQAIATAAADEAVKRYVAGQADASKGVVIVKDEADKMYSPDVRGFKAYLDDVMRSSRPGAETAPKLKAIKAATGAGEAVPADGGFLVQVEHSAMFLENTWNSSTVASRAMRNSVTNGNGMDFYGIDETSRIDGSRWGGVRGYRVAEAAAITASRPKFKRIELKLKKYGVLSYATDELLADTALWAQKMMDIAPKELAFMLDDDVMNGLGANGPLGILASPAMISVAAETGQASATIVPENLLKMWARRLGNSANYAWFYDQSCEPQLLQLLIASGTATTPFRYVDYGPDGILRLFGRPCIPTEFNAALGTVGDIVLANLNDYYQIIDKGGVQAASSIHLQFLYDEQAFRWTYRVDGAPLISSAVTPNNSGDTQSPIVALATR